MSLLNRPILLGVGLLAVLCACVCVAVLVGLRDGPPGGDWPQWRYDAGRGAACPEELPEQLHLVWMRQLPAPRPAWPPSQPSLRFDLSYCPVAAGGLLFVPSMVADTLTAYDTETGKERWRLTTGGPVRLAPIADRGRVYFGSDDGYLYCLDAARGSVLWRFRGGASDRKVLGNGRLISTWPVRGGPVLLDGTIYFTAGIWPFMGIFVHAVDARTGKAVWTNSGEGVTFQTQPHESPAFAGLVPRGHLAATDYGLIAPGGRTQPGCYELDTGRLKYFHYRKSGGRSSQITAYDRWFFYDGSAVDIDDGEAVLATEASVHDGDRIYSTSGGRLVARRLRPGGRTVRKYDGQGEIVEKRMPELKELWRASLEGVPGRLFLKAGSQLVLGEPGKVALITAEPDHGALQLLWEGEFEGRPWSMLAAAEKLFVVTVEGGIWCFGAAQGEPITYAAPGGQDARDPLTSASREADSATTRAKEILDATGVDEGYCLVFGLGDGSLAEALVRASKLRLVAVDPDAKRVDAFRRRMQDAGLYGTRVAAHVGDPASFPAPPYLASLIVAEDLQADRGKPKGALLRAVFRALRPYGGVACLAMDGPSLRAAVEDARLERAKVKPGPKNRSLLVREDPLPGAADWTHEYADAGNSVVSEDRRVKAPLGLLWFGGPPNDEVLPRHGHGPAPQVAAGRLFLEGPDMLRALDIYTGRLLWQKQLPGLGQFYDNSQHQPGAGEIGSNYVSLPDAVYVVYGRKILKLDAASGRLQKEFMPDGAHGGEPANWGYLAAWDDLLIATSTPIAPEGWRPTGSGTLAVVATPSGYRPLIPSHDRWQYLAGTDPDGDWTAVDYPAEGWKAGPAGFGYGDDDDRTVLRDMENKYTRVYVRKEFDGGRAAEADGMALMVNYDDGFVAYLNGKEVARASVGSGSGRNASKIKNHEAKGYETFEFEGFRELLRSGRNVIAIEGHNVNPDSSDFSLDPYLVIKNGGRTPKTPGPPRPEATPLAGRLSPVRYSSASRRLVVMDRHSGERLWERAAKYGFRHNNIAGGAEKVFCIDGLSRAKRAALKRRGQSPRDYKPQLVALDARSGRQVWSTEEDVFGTFLSYSAEHDVLLQAGSQARDRPADESDTGMAAYRGRDGKVLWKELTRKHEGPCMLHGDTILAQGPAYSLLSGKPKLRKHPLTGAPIPWEYTRNYGCNTAVASRHLITFRSAAAGYYDLARHGGTGNLGGFRSGCTSNLIVAGGLLNAPEYTRACTCNYQNQTSLAMIHDPQVEMWTFNALKWDGKPVRRAGINFGAPGDRIHEGTLWLDWPSHGGPSPDLPVGLQPRDVEYLRYHSSRVEAERGTRELSWVAASGVEGLTELSLVLARNAEKKRKYTVRLHFAELRDVRPGQRAFDVRLQGRRVLDGFDVARHAGGVNRAVVKQFAGVEVVRQLRLSLGKRRSLPPILCGIEVLAQGW